MLMNKLRQRDAIVGEAQFWSDLKQRPQHKTAV
ncbi:hypothetical protein LTSEMON_0330, partial [Salmonella enterica subsp. enterica serovar Montevideo str. S5-403]